LPNAPSHITGGAKGLVTEVILMKELYTKPVVDVKDFETYDVVTTSIPQIDGDDD
jgi:hypothetical protein